MGCDVPGITLKQRRLAAANSKWRVYLDHIVDEHGNEVPDYLIIEGQRASPDRITGVALLAESDGRFVLVRSYRHAFGSTIWDLPRGFIDPGENAADSALRELTEETGLRCAPSNLIALGVYAPEPGTMAVRAALFAAIHCEGSPHQVRDELGLESIHLIGRDKMAELVASGEIEDAGLLIAYYRYCAWQAGPHKS
jgi:8-oxo-dGTP pyrophosphatase MutT (NUDIX family)